MLRVATRANIYKVSPALSLSSSIWSFLSLSHANPLSHALAVAELMALTRAAAGELGGPTYTMAEFAAPECRHHLSLSLSLSLSPTMPPSPPPTNLYLSPTYVAGDDQRVRVGPCGSDGRAWHPPCQCAC
jgi:hypothetical protein